MRKRWLRRASWCCIGLAVVLFGYVGVLVGYENIAQGRLSGDWNRQHPAASIPDVTFAPAASINLTSYPHLNDGQPVARLLIPAVGFGAVVTEGDARSLLSSGPGHDDRTGYPGEGRLVVFANHNGFSFSWNDIKPGTDIVVEMPYGRYHYTVTARRIVNGDDTSLISAAPPGERLMLITCWPLWAGALAQQRLAFDALPATGAAP